MFYQCFWRIANAQGSTWMIVEEEIEALSHGLAHEYVLENIIHGNDNMPIAIRSYEIDGSQMHTYHKVSRWEAE